MHFSEIADATVSHRFASRGKARHSDRAQSSAAAKAMRQESASEPGAGDEPSGLLAPGTGETPASREALLRRLPAPEYGAGRGALSGVSLQNVRLPISPRRQIQITLYPQRHSHKRPQVDKTPLAHSMPPLATKTAAPQFCVRLFTGM